MEKEILDNINSKYVLVKSKNELGYIIIDKTTGFMVIIDEPSIPGKELIRLMIEKKVEIYENMKDLPPPSINKENKFPWN